MPRSRLPRLASITDGSFEPSRRNPIFLRDDESLDNHVKQLKIGDKGSPLALSVDEIRINGDLFVDGKFFLESSLDVNLQADNFNFIGEGDLAIDLGGSMSIDIDGGNFDITDTSLSTFDKDGDEFTILAIDSPLTTTAASNMLTLINVLNASNMTNCGIAMYFKQWYYEIGGGSPEDLGKLIFQTEGNWTNVASTRDSKFTVQNSLNGSLQDALTIESDGTATVLGDIKVAATKKLYFDGGTHTYILESADDVLDFYVGTDKMLALDEANDKITMGATNWVAGTVSAGTVTEFSAANSAYAGMILGYTCVGADVADDAYILTTSYVCFDDSGGTPIEVQFITPPSEKVEIEVELYFSSGSSNKQLRLSLSDNATYGSNTLLHSNQFEKIVSTPARGNGGTFTQKWFINDANLSAIGSNNRIWIAASTDSTSGTPTIKWGGDATSEYTNLVLKATALPATIAVGS